MVNGGAQVRGAGDVGTFTITQATTEFVTEGLEDRRLCQRAQRCIIRIDFHSTRLPRRAVGRRSHVSIGQRVAVARE